MSKRPIGPMIVAILVSGVVGSAPVRAVEGLSNGVPAGLPAMTLLGVIVSGRETAIALFRDSATGRTFGKKVGDLLVDVPKVERKPADVDRGKNSGVATWHVAAIKRKTVTLTSLEGLTAVVDVGEQMGSGEVAAALAEKLDAKQVEGAEAPRRILFAPSPPAADSRQPAEQISTSLEWSSVVDEQKLDTVRDGGILSPDREDDPEADQELLQRLLDHGIE